MATGFLNRAAAARWFPAGRGSSRGGASPSGSSPSGVSPRAYLVAGSDRVSVAELRIGLVRHFGQDDPSGLSRSDLDAATCQPAEVFDGLREMPFLASCRIVVVRNAERLLDERRYPGLVEAVRGLDATSLLVMEMGDEKATELAKKPLVAWCLGRQAAAYCYAPRTDADAIKWAAEYCQRRGWRLEAEAAKRVVALVGCDPLELKPELDKLGFVAGERIDLATVAEHLAPHRERVIFEWADAVMAGKPRALEVAADATENGAAGVGAVAALSGRLDDLDAIEEGRFITQWARNQVERHRPAWPRRRRDAARRLLLALNLDLVSRPAETRLARIELATVRLLEV